MDKEGKNIFKHIVANIIFKIEFTQKYKQNH